MLQEDERLAQSLAGLVLSQRNPADPLIEELLNTSRRIVDIRAAKPPTPTKSTSTPPTTRPQTNNT